MLPPRRIRVVSKPGNFFRGRQPTGDVERSAADESFVVAQFRWCNPKLLEFRVNGVIDVAGRSHLRPAIIEILWDHNDFGAYVELAKTRLNKGLPALPGSDDAILS